MLAAILTLVRFFQALRAALREPEFRGLALLVALLLGGGTAFYHWVEDWTWLDSLYFSVVTLATVGYGDLSPKTPAGKIFTMIFILTGVGTLVTFLSTVAQHAVQQRGPEHAFIESLRKMNLGRPRKPARPRPGIHPKDRRPGDEPEEDDPED